MMKLKKMQMALLTTAVCFILLTVNPLNSMPIRLNMIHRLV